MGKILSVDEILAAPDLGEAEVEVPEWGGSVRIRGLSKAAQQHLRKSATVSGQLDPARLEMLLFIHCVVEPRFTEEQYDALAAKSAGAIDRVIKAIAELAGLDEAAIKAAERSFRSGVS